MIVQRHEDLVEEWVKALRAAQRDAHLTTLAHLYQQTSRLGGGALTQTVANAVSYDILVSVPDVWTAAELQRHQTARAGYVAEAVRILRERGRPPCGRCLRVCHCSLKATIATLSPQRQR